MIILFRKRQRWIWSKYRWQVPDTATNRGTVNYNNRAEWLCIVFL